MSKVTRIALVGASGLVGQSLIRLAVGRSDIRIVAIARREIPLPPGARMEVLVAPPENWDDAIAASGAEVLACALGTTWKKAGKSETDFRAVDQHLVLACAKAAKDAGMRQMIAVSSVGADAMGKNFYLKVKGETEQALGRVGIPRLDVLRPGLLRGPREELRPAELVGRILSPLADPFLFGDLAKFRSIKADTVARAIVGLTKEKAFGRFVFEHEAILRAARKAD